MADVFKPSKTRVLLSFAPTVNFSIGSNLCGFTTGDFNGGEQTDFVVGNVNGFSSSDSVIVLLGNGAGGEFSRAKNFAVGANPNFVTLRDFNVDGSVGTG